MQIAKSRDNYFDFLKGVSIFLVFVGHSLQYAHGPEYLHSEMYWNEINMRIIYSFHMPLFVLISGYFAFLSLQRHGTAQFLKNRWITLPVPIIAWGSLESVLLQVTGRETITFSKYLYYLFDTFWFLQAILVCSTLLALLEKIKSRKLKAFLYLLILVSGFFTPDTHWLYTYKCMAPYFIIGYYLAKTETIKYVRKLNAITIPSGLIWVLLIPVFKKDYYMYISKFNLIRGGGIQALEQLKIDAVRFCIGLVGCIFILGLVGSIWRVLSKFEQTLGIRCILWSGKHTLPLYVLSAFLYIYIVYHFPIPVEPMLLLSVMSAIVMMIFCSLIYQVIYKSRFLSWILVGDSRFVSGIKSENSRRNESRK